jgi:hypothetical protein
MLLFDQLLSIFLELFDLLLFFISKLLHDFDFCCLLFIIRNNCGVILLKLFILFHRLINFQINAIKLLLHSFFRSLKRCYIKLNLSSVLERRLLTILAILDLFIQHRNILALLLILSLLGLSIISLSLVSVQVSLMLQFLLVLTLLVVFNFSIERF